MVLWPRRVAARLWAPNKSRLPEITAQPMPVPNASITTSFFPRATPAIHSPSSAVRKSFSSTIGRPSRARLHSSKLMVVAPGNFPNSPSAREFFRSTRKGTATAPPVQSRSVWPLAFRSDSHSHATTSSWFDIGRSAQASSRLCATMPPLRTSPNLMVVPPKSAARIMQPPSLRREKV